MQLEQNVLKARQNLVRKLVIRKFCLETKINFKTSICIIIHSEELEVLNVYRFNLINTMRR